MCSRRMYEVSYGYVHVRRAHVPRNRHQNVFRRLDGLLDTTVNAQSRDMLTIKLHGSA